MRDLDSHRQFIVLRAKLAGLALDAAALRLLLALRREAPCRRYSPDQPRVPVGQPGGGQWTNGDGGGPVSSDANPDNVWQPGSQVAQARGPVRTVMVRGRPFNVTSYQQERDLLEAADRAKEAMDEVARLDPTWKPAPSISAPTTADGAIAAYRAVSQEASARINFLQRDGLPLGFRSRQDFEAFGRTAWDSLAAAGHRDAEPYLRGSSVTGEAYVSGKPFDAGRTSDLDVAVVSPSLLAQAREIGVPVRGQGTRTDVLRPRALEAMSLNDTIANLGTQSSRPVSIVIYRTRDDLVARGPYAPLPWEMRNMRLSKTFGVKSKDIEQARLWVEQVTGMTSEARESSHWGGDYFAFGDVMWGEHVRLINNRDVYDNEPVVAGVDQWPVALCLDATTEDSPLLAKLRRATQYFVEGSAG